jgi:hypothetical protein
MRKSALLLALAPSILCFGDTLTLKTGENVEGTYLGGTARVLRLEINGQVQSFDVANVVGLQFANGSFGQTNQGQPNPSQFSSSSNRVPANQPEYQQGGIELAAGTKLTVRMIDSIDSEGSRLGDTYRASLDEPIMINGEPFIQRGADVTVKLVEDQKSGKIAGRAVLKLVLTSIKLNDRTIDITTDDVVKESSNRAGKSAGVIGGTAALGAIIGGIAGGGKGAAIGAGSGAAVGTGAQVLTKGQRVRIPSETRLEFTLAYAVRV